MHKLWIDVLPNPTKKWYAAMSVRSENNRLYVGVKLFPEADRNLFADLTRVFMVLYDKNKKGIWLDMVGQQFVTGYWLVQKIG